MALIESADKLHAAVCVLNNVEEMRRGQPAGDAVEVTGIDRSTLADLARRLQRKGLLQRRRTKADARAYEVTLTAEGNRILRAAMPGWEKIETRILNTLPPGRREQFLDGLKTIIQALERATTEG